MNCFHQRSSISLSSFLCVCLALSCCVESTWAQTAPSLGQAGAFAVLGGSAVTNTGPTMISGEVGVSPGSAITGFPPGVVTGGSLHFNDAQALQAQADVVSAYNALAGQAPDADLTGQDLGGLTLVAGVYSFSTSAQLTGTLTLDAQGDPNAIFVFQIGSTLTTASGAAVNIINGGSNCRIFWQIGSSATLGTGTSFLGSILALTSITLNTNAMISGRLLARNGAVVLDSNTANVCGVCTPIIVMPASLPNATVGVPYNQMLTASGGSGIYTYAVSAGALPAGLTLSAATGLISGIPLSIGSSSLTISVTDSEGCVAFVDFVIIVTPAGCPTISLLPVALPMFTVGVPYSATITASGGTSPYTFSIVSGSLPPGISLSPTGPASATLGGTPTVAGNYQFVILATDAAGCGAIISYSVQVVSVSTTLPATGVISLLLLFGVLALAGVFGMRRIVSKQL